MCYYRRRERHGSCGGKIYAEGKEHHFVGQDSKKLERAAAELKELGYEVHVHTCDTSDRASVQALAEYASSLGEIKNVINAAGMSPAMASPEQLLRVNALGTVYVNQEFPRYMNRGSVIVDVPSNSAYVLPKFLISKKTYMLAETDEREFIRKLLKKSSLPKGEYERAGFAYAMSKNFVVWYAAKCAFDYGKRGIRVVSLSPGLIATDMGNLEAKEGGSLIRYAAEERMGTPEELGFAIAMAADERNGYLAGVDILCDGGSTNGKKEFKRMHVK